VTARLTRHEVAEFAHVFPPSPALMSLLSEAGIPVDLLPVFYGLDSQEYWNLVNDRIAAGLIEGGRARLLRFAAGRYPANPVFTATSAAPLGRICFVGASPDDMPRVRPGRELRAVLQAVRGNGIEVSTLLAATAVDLGQLVGKWPDLLHLACHCDGETLVFENRDGEARPVAIAEVAQTLGVLMAAAGGPLRGIVLAACRSVAAGRALLPYARTVVAHQGDLDPADAAAFAGHLYQALCLGAELADAAPVAAQLVAQEDQGQPWLKDRLVVLENEDEAGR